MVSRFPAIHGHRGARGRRPENTLAATRFAIECGVDGIEVDLCVSADDVVVVHHDLTLSKNLARDSRGEWADGTIPVRRKPYSSLKHYDVGRLRPGSDYADRFPLQQPIDGSPIPTLDQFIQTVVRHAPPDVILNLELKGQREHPDLLPPPEAYVDLVLNQIDAHGVAHRTYLQSFDWQLERLARTRRSDLSTGLLTDMQPDAAPDIPSQTGDTAWTDGWSLASFDHSVPAMVKATGCRIWSSNFRDLTPDLIRDAHNLDLEVYVWTVNDLDDMKRMVEWGVDAITTDYPDRLVALRDQST